MRSSRRSFVLPSVLASLSLLASPLDLGGQSTQPPLLTLVQDARFGGEGDSTGVVQPQVATVAPNGHALVFDYRTREIKAYDPTGKFVRRIARNGQGPGEVRRVGTMGYLGDTLWASDPELRRISLFPPGGGDPKTFPIRYEPAVIGTFMGQMPQGMMRGGFAVAQGVLFPSRPVSATTVGSPIVLMRRDGTIADTVAMPTVQTAREISFRSIDSQGRQVTHLAGQPFRAEHFWGSRADGRGIVLVSPSVAARGGEAAFTVQTFDSIGRQVRSQSYPYQPIPVTARMRDSVINAIGRRGGGDATATVREQLELSDFVPAVTDIRVGRDGSVWVRRERLRDGGLLWNVIDPGGKLVGRVMMPTGAQVMYADMDCVVTQERDADGVTWIVRYHLRGRITR